MRLVLEPEAQADIEQAHDWYESKVHGLGLRFEEHLDIAFQWIVENVQLCRVVGKDVRRYNLGVFPFSIYFQEVQGSLRVIAVLHGARNPQVMQRRLKP